MAFTLILLNPKRSLWSVSKWNKILVEKVKIPHQTSIPLFFSCICVRVPLLSRGFWLRCRTWLWVHTTFCPLVVGQRFDRHKLPSSSSKLDLEEALHCTWWTPPRRVRACSVNNHSHCTKFFSVCAGNVSAQTILQLLTGWVKWCNSRIRMLTTLISLILHFSIPAESLLYSIWRVN